VSRLWRKIIPAIVLLWPARAQAATVVVVRPASTAPALTETVSRLRGELLSLGLEVVVGERPGGAHGAVDPRAWLERDAGERAPDAVIDVVGDGAPAAVDIWVLERKTGSVAASRVALGAGRGDPGQLAIRAVEVLRSSLVEIDLAARTRRAPTAAPEPPVASAADGRADARRAGPFGVQAGAAMLASLDGVGPALTPIVRIDWAARSWFAVQATLAGLGSRPEITSTSGSARVAQQYATLGGCVCASSPQRIGLVLALSAGALRTAVDGQADPPSQAHFVERWSFLLDASVGARLRLSDRYHLTLAAHAQVAEPYVAIHFMDGHVATTGRPNLALSLTLGAWL